MEDFREHLSLGRNLSLNTIKSDTFVLKHLYKYATDQGPKVLKLTYPDLEHFLASLSAIRDMLGHADIATTEIYTHVELTGLRDEILPHHPRNK